MPHRLAADLQVDSFGVTVDGATRRLDFPRAEADGLEGASGRTRYGARELVLDRLQTRLDRMHWTADAASAGGLWLRTDDGSVELTIDRVEMPHGMMLARAAGGGVEIRAPHASLSDVKLTVPDLGALRRPAPADGAAPKPAPAPRPSGSAELRQRKLRFLDALAGQISVTIKVQLDLPVIGRRTLDQALRIPIQNGSLDFRALEDGLDWLEGAFLALGIEHRRLAVSWGVPIIAPAAKDIISFELDEDAQTLATFDRVPLRSLADFRFPTRGAGAGAGRDGKRRSVLRSLTLGGIDVALSLAAPRSVDVGGGTILLGGEDAPGIVDFEVHGSLTHPPAPGSLRGTIGVVDATLKDVRAGGVGLTVDRLHFGGVETFDLTFEGFRPVGLTAFVNRVTATNLSLFLGGDRSTPSRDDRSGSAR